MASIANMCLAVNGGTLGSGASAADRDNDFNTGAHSVSGQSGSFSVEIIFPQSKINYIKYRLSGASYPYDGTAAYNMEILLNVNGTWTSVWSVRGSGGTVTDRNIQDESENNSGVGWENVTGIKVTGSVTGTDTGSASVTTYEMQAWGDLHLDYGGVV